MHNMDTEPFSNRPGAPLFATVNVTGVCNLSCRYCFFQPRRWDVMAFGDFKRVILELAGMSVFFVNLSGGEPFAHPEIDKFIEFAHEHLKYVVILTNGTILRARHLDAIRRVIAAKGSFPIQVSLDAWDPAVNSLTRCESTRVISNLYKLRELGANIVIAMVITQYNIQHALGSIRQLANLTRFFHVMSFQPVKALHGADASCQVAKDEMHRFWVQLGALREELNLEIDSPLDDDPSKRGCAVGAPCMAAFSNLVIDPNLDVRPCDRVVDFQIGNLRASTLSQIWDSKTAKAILALDTPMCRS